MTLIWIWNKHDDYFEELLRDLPGDVEHDCHDDGRGDVIESVPCLTNLLEAGSIDVWQTHSLGRNISRDQAGRVGLLYF